MLADRGKECKGCSEKSEFVDMAYDNQHLPVIEKPVSKNKKPKIDNVEEVGTPQQN